MLLPSSTTSTAAVLGLASAAFRGVAHAVASLVARTSGARRARCVGMLRVV
ncbi:hypothetical protein [Pararobbsia alpina]|uniref:hypothetical protein n=1 Tax=Pararobbsia alpina TaxID=621374 RepID=UPI00158430D4|nr:hypothetical protein [Pararobbsia alpina]